MNLTVVTGRVERPPAVRQLRGGERIVTFDVASPAEEGRPAEAAVPITWPEPASGLVPFDVGEEVVVVGRVRRRFFRVGPHVQSRTEVAAEEVLRPRQRVKLRRALESAAEALADYPG